MTHRILHIVSSHKRGASQTSLLRLARDLPRDEFELRVCALSSGGGVHEHELRAAGVSLSFIGRRLAIDPFAYAKLRATIRELRPQLVQTWGFAANSYGQAAAKAAGVRAVVASEQCVAPLRPWHQQIIDRRLAGSCSRIVVNAPHVRDFFVSRGIAAEKFVVVPGGVAASDLPVPDATSRAALLEELGLPGDARLIGSLGRLTARKHLRDPVWAADLLKVVRDDVHYLIIGDGPERHALARYRDHVEIRDRVHFLGDREDVPKLLAHLDLLWHTSGYEGLPYPVMQAMAAGIPVVATDIPGNRDLVVPEETGYLVPVGDRASMARRANNLLDDQDLATQLGQAGRERVLAKFPATAMVAAYAELYRELIGE